MQDIHTHAGIGGQDVTRYTPGQAAPAPANIPRVTVGNIQGVTSWSAADDASEDGLSIPQRQASNSRVHTGHVSFINGVQQGPESTVTRQSAADLAPASSGILGTVRNNAGFPTANITPNCTVEIPGAGRTSVKAAVTLGYLSVTADGRYVAPGGASGNVDGGLPAQSSSEPQQTADTPQQQQDGNGLDLFSDPSDTSGQNVEAAYGEMIEPLQQATYDSMLASATTYLTTSGDIDGLIATLTGRYGSDIASEFSAFSPDYDMATADDGKARAAELIKAGAAVWQEQADRHVKAAGIDPEHFYEWARTSNPDALKAAIQGQLFGRSLKGYSTLMESYLGNVPPTLEALQRGGIPTKEQGGTVFVQIGGTWTPLQAAVKARMV